MPEAKPAPALLRLSPLLALAVLAGACATAHGGSWSGSWWVQNVPMEGSGGVRTLQVRYRAGSLSSRWEASGSPPGDFAFYHPGLGATIYADSSCGSRYDDAPLNILTNHLTMGFEDLEVIEDSELNLSDRAGLERISHAQLDGVPVRVASSVIKKGPCVFDMILVASPGGFDAALRDYRDFRDGFDARVGR